MIILSLFDGISSGRVALDRAGIHVANYFASEIDKYAIKVSQNNYPDIIRLGDINNWENWDVPWSDIDLILAGSPCQGFSFAGKQLAFDDKRSALFFRFAEILAHVQSLNPNVSFLLENVRMKKEHENVITSIVGVDPVMINSALVSAQNRKRLYWCNWNVEQPADKCILLKDVIHETIDITNHDKLPVFNCNPSGRGMNGTVTPITNDKNPTLTTNKGEGNKIAIPFNAVVGIKQNPRGKNRGGIHTEKSPALTSNSWEHNNHLLSAVVKDNFIDSFIVPFDKTLQILDKETIAGKIGFFRSDCQSGRIYSIHGKAVTLCGDAGGGAAKMGQYLFGCITPDRIEKRQNGRRFSNGEKFYTLTAQDRHGILIDGYIRKLTPIECERLQTLPDNYTAGVSNTQRYKMLGNGWTVDVITHLLKHMKG
ncbi:MULTISPECIES: DNA (cytosine-5-)-methyltransferase [unclassified Gilliamella]|uniref:DNA (cytosine-5-)-methyltransferase n=1 Tax=unclassified Gilliamella TaxID=2685620 RepID=UPI00226AACA6|nr:MULTISPECIES: DNA (cytosine-5-)-methyltransferase [unclassified Gilliamella]MCX8574546.1 DNA (cytosine-5-)-methyltransferase [Gilliamella sp. B3831]MCX8576777.1 DNA (cytosine-5-)-methyltransferase [Gilliamella sp. B3815]MCX8589241.1 DNA (cytosine-5-)-methyltransferase [Gilliamella sp. B3812]MCX8603815.1 DNA (cytosine-5-)-methyltransferase [Gilliamella sp. B3823]MCX8606695.1 DNA (cytosine-5-)-methyltransferase [Gilliamella sp. B3825]